MVSVNAATASALAVAQKEQHCGVERRAFHAVAAGSPAPHLGKLVRGQVRRLDGLRSEVVSAVASFCRRRVQQAAVRTFHQSLHRRSYAAPKQQRKTYVSVAERENDDRSQGGNGSEWSEVADDHAQQ